MLQGQERGTQVLRPISHLRPSAMSAPEPAATTAAAPEPASDRAPTIARTAPADRALPSVPASSVELQSRLKPILSEGTNMKMASAGFRDGEQFASVAHAARNVGIPFMVLKQRVLEGKMSLAAAIRELKSDANPALEATRARILARADIASITL